MLQPDNLKVNNITDKSSAWRAYGLVFDFILITNIFLSETSNHVLYKIKNIYFLYFRREQCVEDWVEIYQIYRNMNEELVGRYCSQSSPGPVVSLSDVAVGLKVFLHTDSKDVYSGFLGKYTFFPAKSSEKEGTFSMISDYILYMYKIEWI